jgi:hypothetical protein
VLPIDASNQDTIFSSLSLPFAQHSPTLRAIIVQKLPSIHPLIELRGSPRSCGRQYGERQAEAIEAFLHTEVTPDAKRLRYAARCWRVLSRWKKHVSEFVRGMAEGSHLAVEEVTLLLLHEEIVHCKPCTAVGATGPGTADGKPIIGQNWDWNPRLYPWAGLTRLHARGIPASFFYSYPGLWASAGINEHGFSLVWTGAGYLPTVRPVVGIPTYALIAGLLACRDCQQALKLLRETRLAGCFIFFIADARREVWVVEGLPRRFEAVRCEDVISRANHYQSARICRLSRQPTDPPPNPGTNTWFRGRRMSKLAQRYRGRFDRHLVEKCLCDEFGGMGKSICQRPGHGRRSLSIDSFYCLPVQRQFWIARGVPSSHEYRCYSV